jgi:hypothetical protein
VTITILPGDPFFTGISTSPAVPTVFPVAIAGHPYVVELSKYRRRTLPALRPPQDSAAEPGENSLNTEGYWRRSQTDWSLGAGQEYFDNEDSSRRRFLSSKGVHVWERDALSLLPDTALRESSSDTNLKTLAVNGYFYFVEGSTLKYTQDPSASSPSWTTVTTTGLGSITGLATTGSTIYACDGAKLMSGAVGGAALADLGALTPDRLFFCNGRLIGMDADLVYEIAAAGTKTDIKDHDNSSFVWNCATGAPNGIYVAGNSGDRSEVYYVGVDTSTGALLAPVHAMKLPNGETINAIENDGGRFVTIGSSAGFRLAVIDSDNGLSHGPLVEISGGVTDFEPRGKFVYFTWKNYDSTSTGIGTMNLSEFTQSLVPAYATDLMATTQGAVQSVAHFGGKRYFAVSGAGLYGESTDLVSSGTLTSSKVRYSTAEQKVVSSIDLRHDALAGTIGASVTSDSGDVATTAGSVTASSLGPAAPLTLGTFVAESFSVTLTLNRSGSDATSGPTLRRWTVRAIATPFRTEEFIVPLVLKRRVAINGGEYPFDPQEEFLYLKSLESSRRVVRYQEGNTVHNVYVDGVAIEAPSGWLPDYSFYEGDFIVRLLTVEV